MAQTALFILLAVVLPGCASLKEVYLSEKPVGPVAQYIALTSSGYNLIHESETVTLSLRFQANTEQFLMDVSNNPDNLTVTFAFPDMEFQKSGCLFGRPENLIERIIIDSEAQSITFFLNHQSHFYIVPFLKNGFIVFHFTREAFI